MLVTKIITNGDDGSPNQSVENAGVAFVKVAIERNEFLEKIN